MFKFIKIRKPSKSKVAAAYKEGFDDGYGMGSKVATNNAFNAGYDRGKDSANGNLRQAFENEIRHLKWVIQKLESKPEDERDGDIAQQNVAKAVDGWLYGAWQKASKDNIQEAKAELLEVLINKLRELAAEDEFWIVKPVENDQVNVAWRVALPHLEPEKDYKHRMIEEYWQTKARYSKLHDMLIKYEAGTLDFTPTCSLELLTKQASAMGNYLKCLEIRAQIEGITLL